MSDGMNTNSWCFHAVGEHKCDATNPRTNKPYVRCFRKCSMFSARPLRRNEWQ